MYSEMLKHALCLVGRTMVVNAAMSARSVRSTRMYSVRVDTHANTHADNTDSSSFAARSALVRSFVTETTSSMVYAQRSHELELTVKATIDALRDPTEMKMFRAWSIYRMSLSGFSQIFETVVSIQKSMEVFRDIKIAGKITPEHRISLDQVAGVLMGMGHDVNLLNYAVNHYDNVVSVPTDSDSATPSSDSSDDESELRK